MLGRDLAIEAEFTRFQQLVLSIRRLRTRTRADTMKLRIVAEGSSRADEIQRHMVLAKRMPGVGTVTCAIEENSHAE